MFEKKFLAYLLYITLLELRENAYRHNDSRLYHLADLLHNVPFSLLNDKMSKDEYNKLLDAVKELDIYDWLDARKKEFDSRFPSCRINK